jgi:puromycin-sensitive aminopeptidase
VVTEFAAGAMENWGLVTYRESALLIDEATAEIAVKQRVALVVCHELAHQWFGNLVTMTWWCDLWLNEGFASYMQHLAVDRICPEWHIWDQYTIDTFGLALKLDSLRSSHPIQVPIKHAEEVEEIFDSISYAKGSTVVRMAQHVLGFEKFRDGLREYMQIHKYGNTETHDLWEAWSNVSGLDIGGLMNSWTSRMGHPYISIVDEEWTATEVKLKLKQSWFLADGSGANETGSVWNIPLLIGTEGQKRDHDAPMIHSDIATTETFSVTVPLSSPSSWVKLNDGQCALMRCAHSAEMINRLIPAIVSKQLSPIDRASLIDDSYWLATASASPVELIAKVVSAFHTEDNATVWKALAPVLVSIYKSLAVIGGEAAVKFKEFAKSIVLPALSIVGWDSVHGESELQKITRHLIFTLIEVFGNEDPEIVAESRRRFNICIDEKDENILSADIRGPIFRIVLHNGGVAEYEKVLATYYATTEDAKRKWALTTLGASQSPELKLRCMEWSISGDVKLQDCYTPMNSVSSSDHIGANIAWKFYKDNIERIKSMLSTSIPWTMNSIILSCCSKFHTFDMANDIKTFFELNPNEKAERTITQTIERIRIAANFDEKIKNSKFVESEFWSNL